MEITCHPAGELCKARELLGFVSSGAIELGSISAIYLKGTMPIGNLVAGGVLNQWKTWQEAKENFFEFKDGELAEIVREAYAKQGNCYWLFAYSSGDYAIFGSSRIEKWDDLKGTKVRCSQVIIADWVKMHGGTPVTTAPAEMYPALQRGTLDLITYPTYTYMTYKFYEVGKYLTAPPWGHTMGGAEIFANLDAWNNLPKDMQEILLQPIPGLLEYQGKMVEEMLEETRNKCPEWGSELVIMPDSELKAYDDYSMSRWDEFGAQDEYMARGIANIREYLKSIGKL